MSSFFTLPESQRKRKRTDAASTPPAKRSRSSHATSELNSTRRPKKQSPRDESISGSDSDENRRNTDLPTEDDSISESEDETGAERRLRLAEQYLKTLKEGSKIDEIGYDAAIVDRDLIAERLKEDVVETKGLLHRRVASQYNFSAATATQFRINNGGTTSVAVCSPYVYTVSKDRALIKWEIPAPTKQEDSVKNPRKPRRPPRLRPMKLLSASSTHHRVDKSSNQHHTAGILCVAASGDGRFVATGGADRRLIVWSADDLSPLRVFNQHRDAVTGLVFRRGTNQLYSSSSDRTIKVWSLNELAYVETLFGHQDQVVDVAALTQERCISAGARDRTVRLWKIAEETQLVFRGGGSWEKGNDRQKVKKASAFVEGSIERVSLVDDETFVTGSDNGSLAIWSLHKKKPVFVVPLAHGVDPPPQREESFAELDLSDRTVVTPPAPRWITALKVLPYSDLILTGSWDGKIRVWKITEDKRRIEPIGSVGDTLEMNKEGLSGQEVEDPRCAARGVINDLELFERGDKGSDELCVVAALGKEHRLGRWKKVNGKNGAMVFQIPRERNPGQEPA